MADEVNQRRSRNRELTPWADIEAAAPVLPAPAAPSGGNNQFGEWDLGDRPSRSKGVPLDHNGSEFMSNHEVANIFGIGEHNSKAVSYSAIPQFIEHKGQGARDTTRTWYSKEHVVNHLSGLLKSGKTKEEKAASQARWGGFHKKLSGELAQERESTQRRRNNGENTGHLWSQVHPGHKDIHLRMEYAPHGRVMPEGEATSGAAFGSSLAGARRSGNLVPVGEGPGLPSARRGRVRP